MTRFALAVLAGAMLMACQGLDHRDDIPEPSASAPAPGEEFGSIDWDDCGSVECATVSAPLDYADTDGETINVYVARKPARGERIGALWLNFGGPGASAASTIEFWPVPDEISEHFDIVGMDPRGVGRSTPLACGISTHELYAADPTIDEPADVEDLLAVSQDYVDDCADRVGDLLPHMGTRNVARDMDLIRSMMGDDAIDYLGYSYGTSIGQAYADEFPDHIRTMVLDGIVDPGLDGIQLATGQAAGFESTLQRWADGCDARGCPLQEPLAAVDEFLARAESGIPAGDATLGPGEAATALAYPLYSEDLWPALDAAVAGSLESDATDAATLAGAYADLVDYSIYFAVSCLDSSWPSTPEEILAAGRAAATESPHFGEAIVNDYVRCALWPVEPDPLGPITAPDAPPILVVSTTGDAATPHENGVAVAARLESGRLLTHEGEGHTVVFGDDECVDDLVIAYLVDQVLPPENTVC